MRIKLSYQSWSYPDSSSIGAALKSATGSVMAFIERLLQVNRVGVRVTVSRCYDVDVPAVDRNVLLDYDLVVYATAVAGVGYFASAVACQLSPTPPTRSQVGRISYNTGQMTA